MSDGLLQRIDEFARADHRSRSGAVQVLLERALEPPAVAGPDVTVEPKVVAATAGVPLMSGPAKAELVEPEKPSPMKGELCGFRNPQVPFYSCVLPQGHAGAHEFR